MHFIPQTTRRGQSLLLAHSQWNTLPRISFHATTRSEIGLRRGLRLADIYDGSGKDVRSTTARVPETVLFGAADEILLFGDRAKITHCLGVGHSTLRFILLHGNHFLVAIAGLD